MKAIIIKELRLIRKDKRSFFFLLLMPILFIIMFGSIFGKSGDSSSIAIHTIDQDQSAASAAFIVQMGKIMTVTQDANSSLNDQINKIKQGQFSSVLVIPAGFESDMKQGKQASIHLYQDPSAGMSLAPIQAILGSISGQYREQKLAEVLVNLGANQTQAEQDLSSPISIQNIPTSSDHFDFVDQVVPGMTVMFVFYIMMSMARRIFDEKKTGLLSRIRSTTVKPLPYLIGLWIPFVLTVIAQCVILFAFGHYVYHLKLGDLSALGLIIFGLSIAGTGIGLGLSFIVPGENAAMVITQLVSMGGAMVGGLWMPSFLLPKVVQNIGHFTPQYWAQSS
ncbi:MAG: transporter permease, partial [Bacilli bacterium]|nr:transporter permease [Bacilli bacterium]